MPSSSEYKYIPSLVLQVTCHGFIQLLCSTFAYFSGCKETSPGRVWSGGPLWRALLTSRSALTEGEPHRSSTETPCQRRRRRRGSTHQLKGLQRENKEGWFWPQKQTGQRWKVTQLHKHTHTHKAIITIVAIDLMLIPTATWIRKSVWTDKWKMTWNHVDSFDSDNCWQWHAWRTLSGVLVDCETIGSIGQ